MEPRIQYAKTEDGVSIAYWTLGSGTPLILMPSSMITPTTRAWATEAGRQWFERLAEKRMLIRYDNRGCGHSGSNVGDYSLGARVLDLRAVTERLSVEQFDLFGYWQSGPEAIAYTARNSDRVSHLILWCTSARGTDFYRGEDVDQALSEVAAKDWRFYAEMIAHSAFGWSGGEQARLTAADIVERLSPETVEAVGRATMEDDVTRLLPQVRTPTLVLHRRERAFPQEHAARTLASSIAEARLAILEGDSIAPYVGDMESALAAIEDFLGDARSVSGQQAHPPSAGVVHTLLFTDIVGHTEMMRRLGDESGREVLREHERIVREALKAHGGAEVKTMGDGFMASFASAAGALECAVAIQRAFAERNESADEPISVRVGLNAGEPIAEDEDLFGAAVIRAARIAALAEAGEILIANVVRELTEGKGFLFSDRGEIVLRGFDDPARLFEVRWE